MNLLSDVQHPCAVLSKPGWDGHLELGEVMRAAEQLAATPAQPLAVNLRGGLPHAL